MKIERVDHPDRSLLLKYCKSKLAYILVLLNKKEIINKHQHMLSVNSSFKEIFNNIQPMIAFRKKTSLKQLVEKKKKKKATKDFSHLHEPYEPQQQVNLHHFTPFNHSDANNFSKQQHLQARKQERSIFHQVTCHRNYDIYLLECVMCNIQYAGRSERSFNIRLKNHRKDM